MLSLYISFNFFLSLYLFLCLSTTFFLSLFPLYFPLFFFISHFLFLFLSLCIPVSLSVKIVRFLSGLVEIHGADGVAAIFGVHRLPMSLIIRPHDLMKDSSDGDKDRDRVRRGETIQEVGDYGGTNSNQEESIDSSGVHYIVLCWILATRTLDQHPSNLSPRGLLLSELVDRTGRLLDGIAGYISPQEWSEVDDEIVNRQMTQRVAKSIHPQIQKQLKENPFYNLW